MFCSYSFEKLLCWTCWLTASIHRWTQRPCESQRSWNDRKVALFWFWSTLQRELFNLPSCFKTTFWPCEGHKSCLVSRQTALTTAHGRSEHVWETRETAKYHRLDFNKHSENTLWACFFFICLRWTRCTSVSLTLGNDLSRPQIEKNADTSGNRGDCSAQEMSNPPKPHSACKTLHTAQFYESQQKWWKFSRLWLQIKKTKLPLCWSDGLQDNICLPAARRGRADKQWWQQSRTDSR